MGCESASWTAPHSTRPRRSNARMGAPIKEFRLGRANSASARLPGAEAGAACRHKTQTTQMQVALKAREKRMRVPNPCDQADNARADDRFPLVGSISAAPDDAACKWTREPSALANPAAAAPWHLARTVLALGEALVLGAAALIGAAYLAVGFAKSPEQVGVRSPRAIRPGEQGGPLPSKAG